MAEKGIVTKKKGDLIVIKMTRTEACAECRACVAGLSEQEMFIEADNQCGADEGDWVEIQLTENGFFNAILIMYGLPFLALIAGIFVGYFALAPILGLSVYREIFSFGLGIVCTLLAYLWIRSQESRWEKRKYRPIATKIVGA